MAVRVRFETIEFGEMDIHIRGLRDTNEFEDVGGEAELLGISPSMWPLFGVVWEAARVLAERMVDRDVEGLRVLEVGCGLGLASLVLNHRDADITATDRHPEAEAYLAFNTDLNGGETIPFERAGWDEVDTDLGTFDLIIGSDLLYEQQHVALLSGFVDRHAKPTCEVVLVDGGRGHAGRMARRMATLGFAHRVREPSAFHASLESRVQVHCFERVG